MPVANAADCVKTTYVSGSTTTLVFTSADNTSCTLTWDAPAVQGAKILMVGGGGGGGGRTYSGGGGGGGVVYFSSINLTASTYSLQVGGGGAGGAGTSTGTPCSVRLGSSGGSSWFSSSSIAANGGGGGGGNCSNTGQLALAAIGRIGGSGGGGGEVNAPSGGGSAGATSDQTAPSIGIYSSVSFGYSGGRYGYAFNTGSGGGGAGAAGSNALTAGTGASGGIGIATTTFSNITSVAVLNSPTYIAGGGGGAGKSNIGAGGNGGGGAGGKTTTATNCVSGTPLTGGGGGGSGGSPVSGCSGGSGFILITYSPAYSIASATALPTSASVATGYSASSTQTTVSLTRAGSAGSNPTTTLSVTAGTWTATVVSGVTLSTTTVTSAAPITVTLTAASGSYTLSLNSGSGVGSYVASDTSTMPLSYTVTVFNPKLDVPASLTANPASQTLKTIIVSWQASSNASSYTLKLYSSDESLLITISSLTDTSRNITTSDYASLVDGGAYKVSIQAIGTGSYESSDISVLVSVSTTALQPSEVSLTLISGQPVFLTSKSLSAYTVFAGTVNFKANGKSIAGCTKKISNSGNSFTASCSWKPAVRSVVTITATFTPTSGLYLASTSTSQQVSVSPRTGSRP